MADSKNQITNKRVTVGLDNFVLLFWVEKRVLTPASGTDQSKEPATSIGLTFMKSYQYSIQFKKKLNNVLEMIY